VVRRLRVRSAAAIPPAPINAARRPKAMPPADCPDTGRQYAFSYDSDSWHEFSFSDRLDSSDEAWPIA